MPLHLIAKCGIDVQCPQVTSVVAYSHQFRQKKKMKKGAASRQVTKKRRVDHLIIKMAIDTMYGIYVYFWLNEH
jgi:hypothetical protein